MENNRYAQHKKEIREISEREGVDIGVACAMLRDKMGWTFEETKGVDRELCLLYTSTYRKLTCNRVIALLSKLGQEAPEGPEEPVAKRTMKAIRV